MTPGGSLGPAEDLPLCMERSGTIPKAAAGSRTAANGHHPQDKFVGEGLTYDDVLLVPAYSEVLPRDVDIRTRFSRNIQLNTPVVSAAMDTVTGADLAIAIAAGWAASAAFRLLRSG